MLKRFKNIFKGGPPEIFSSQFHKYIIPCPLTDGSFRIQHSTVIAMKSSSGKEYYAVCSMRDLTDEYRLIKKYKSMRDKALAEIEERKKTEEKLQHAFEELRTYKDIIETRSQELAELNQNKDKLFSIIGHDLKNPLQALIGYSEILTEEFYDLTDDEKLEFISSIQNISVNVKELLINLLNWAKLQSDKIEISSERAALFPIVQKINKLLCANARSKEIRISLNVNEDHMAFFDVNMIETAVRNLVTNAIKFTPRGGEIVISSEIVENALIIFVKDNGIGIPEERIKDLFKIGAKNSTRGTENEEGTGLGLKLCKELVNANNGAIDLTSEVNKGTEVAISLPRFPR